MFGAAILLASALAPVTVPYDVQRKLFSNYPTWAVRDERSSATLMEAIVEPDGKIRECRVVTFVGSDRLANEECATLSRRRLKPATDLEGRAIVGLFRTNISRFIQSRSPEVATVRNWEVPADIVLPNEGLADRPAGRVDFGIALLVRDDGSVAACERSTSDTGEERVPSVLVEAACAEAGSERRRRLTAADGMPTAYVANLRVRIDAPLAS
jgi:hypothetical protein